MIALIRMQQKKIEAKQDSRQQDVVKLEQVQSLFPSAKSVTDANLDGRQQVLDEGGNSIGYVVQTSPQCDHLIGFSGPTNTLIAFSSDDPLGKEPARIVGIDVISSGDTRDHLNTVLEDESFLQSFNGLTWEEASTPRQVDGVTGATLTSLTIRESIIVRLSDGESRERVSLRFPDPIQLSDVQHLFPQADAIQQDENHPSLWHLHDAEGNEIGSILRTSPHADNTIGFQGPTETLIGFDSTERIIGISLGKSYDNEEYVRYVRGDSYFLSLFNELVLDDLANLKIEDSDVEGVSGATMTSMAVAEGLITAASQHQKALATKQANTKEKSTTVPLRDIGTVAVIFSGIAIAFTRLRGNKFVRVIFQLVLVGYLGLTNGDLISQAMIAGWAKHRIPWTNATGLVALTLAALIVPLTTRRNVYCTHLCPHGAAQHLLKNRVPWRLRISSFWNRVLKSIPALLLGWCVIVSMSSLAFSLVDIEPFDAWVFRVAGWATISIAVIGLIASLFVPMAYCKYGCPTGAMLNFLRFNLRSDQWSRRDWVATLLLVIALVIWGAT